MNTLSYLSLMEQSLVRYDMANDMLKWAQAMSKTSLAKRNFRQLKKFLQNKGYEYERPYPYKGKERCTISLLDIVRENNTKEFLELHGGVEGVAKSMARLVGTGIPTQPGDELIAENATFKFLAEGVQLSLPGDNLHPSIPTILMQGKFEERLDSPEIDVRLQITDLQELIDKRYGGCTKLEQEEDLPVHKVTTIKATQFPQYLSVVLGPKGPTLVNQDGVELRLTNDDLHPTVPTISMQGQPVTEVKSWMPPSQESVDEVNRILKDVIEGKIEGNPLDLYGITTRTQPYSIMKEQDND